MFRCSDKTAALYGSTEQNPDGGIETKRGGGQGDGAGRSTEQNPDGGIETR